MSATSSPTLDFLTTFAATTPVAGTAAVTPESIRVRAISRAAIWSGRIITGVISMGTIGRRCGWIRATSSSEATSGETRRGEWSGRQDSNLRLLAPKASALPG
jgi:hypothetical protein